MSPLKFTVYEHAYTISPPDPPEVEWGSTGDDGLEANVTAAYASNPRGARLGWVESDDLFESDEIAAGETAYVVCALYTDGDTFGSSGYFTICGYKSSYEAADAMREKLEKGESDKNAWLPWNGYFASLNNIWVDSFIVQP